MMSNPIRILALALFATSCASVSVIPRYGRLDVGGHIGINSTSSGLSSRNEFKEAGLRDDTGVPSGRVDLEAGGTHATFEISDSGHGGSGTLQADVSDGTTTIPAGTDVDSKLDLTMGEAMVTWDLVPGDLVEAGVGIGASVLDLDASFTAPSLSRTVGTHRAIPVPLLALRAGVDLGRFDVSALLGGMDAHVDGNDLTYYDLDLMARLKVLGAAGKRIGAIVLGYRYVDLQLEYKDSSKNVDAAARFSGPYIGFSLGF